MDKINYTKAKDIIFVRDLIANKLKARTNFFNVCGLCLARHRDDNGKYDLKIKNLVSGVCVYLIQDNCQILQFSLCKTKNSNKKRLDFCHIRKRCWNCCQLVKRFFHNNQTSKISDSRVLYIVEDEHDMTPNFYWNKGG